MSYGVLVRLLPPDEPAQGWRADRVEAERTTTAHRAAPYGLTVLAPDLAAAADVGRVEKRLLLFGDARHKAPNRRTGGQRRQRTDRRIHEARGRRFSGVQNDDLLIF